MDASTELSRLTELCKKLGSTERQAAVMAAQIQKRADQLSIERGISREEAMSRLLTLVVEGSQGRSSASNSQGV